MGTQTTLASKKVQEIKDYINSPEFNICFEKAYKGNKSAITKLRVGLSKVSNLCKEGRTELSSIKNNLSLTKK